MLVYQRVNLHFPMVFLWFSYGFPIFHGVLYVYRRVQHHLGSPHRLKQLHSQDLRQMLRSHLSATNDGGYLFIYIYIYI